MDDHLLATKFNPPPLPPRGVQRPRLAERLDAGLAEGKRLTLIAAPAGFGKTVCLRAWLARLERSFAWLTLDSADDEPLRFYAYLVAALQRLNPAIGQELVGALRAGQTPPAPVLVTVLVNDILACAQPFVLALDDFHLIQEPAILDTLEGLLAAAPPELHLALATREDPSLPLARLRAYNQMTEVRAADLRFSPAEVEVFLQQTMSLSLDQADVAALVDRTEGWAAGLQLAGLSLRGRADPSAFITALSGSQRYILSYLTEEVLAQQPPETQAFLLQTAVLERLHGDLCDALTGRSDGRDRLERLLRANLFITPLDEDAEWYRYHPLFADLLRSRQARLAPAAVQELHRRAAAWFTQAGMGREAVEHALAAGDEDAAVRLLEQYAMPLMRQGHLKALARWREALSPAARAASPRLNLAFAWMALLRGDYPQSGLFLDQALAALEQARLDPPQAAGLRAEALTLQANRLHVMGRAQESLNAAEQALELAPPEAAALQGLAHLGLGGAYRQLGDYPRARAAYLQAIRHSRAAHDTVADMLAVSALALTAIQHGQLHLADRVGREALDAAGADGPPAPIVGAVYGALGLAAYEWNRLEEAQTLFARSLHLAALAGHNATLVYTRAALAGLALAQGDLQEAGAQLAAAEDALRRGAPAWLWPDIAGQQARLRLAHDDPQGAEAALDGLAPAFRQSTAAREMLELAALRIILHRALAQPPQNLAAAIARARSLAQQAQTGGRVGLALQALLLLAQLQWAAGDRAGATAGLQQALALGEPEGYVRSFLEAGPLLGALLQHYPAGEPQRAYAERLLAAFSLPAGGQQPGEPQPAADSQASALIDPLTERELDVLQLFAAGLTYDQIADRLVISVNTVRYHVKSLYAKLYVNNRTQAVAEGRRLRLL